MAINVIKHGNKCYKKNIYYKKYFHLFFTTNEIISASAHFL